MLWAYLKTTQSTTGTSFTAVDFSVDKTELPRIGCTEYIILMCFAELFRFVVSD